MFMQDHHLNELFSLNLLLRMLNLIKAALVFLGILSVLILFPMSAAYGSEWNFLMPWDADTINVVIESDFDVDDSRTDIIKSVIESETKYDIKQILLQEEVAPEKMEINLAGPEGKSE